MKIKTVKIKGFRLLNDFTIGLEDNLSLIIGKNNTGKTSFLTVLDKFLNGSKNSWDIDDFNLDLQNKIKNACITKISDSDYEPFMIQLKLYLEYVPTDSSKNYSALIMDLDADNYIYIISFEYALSYKNYVQLFEDFHEYKQHFNDADVIEFLKKNITNYFEIFKKVLESGNEDNFNAIDGSVIEKIINLQFISAKRDVANSDSDSKPQKTLSKLSSKYYEVKPKQEIAEITPIQEQLRQTDKSLSEKYKHFFQPIYESFKKFATNGSEVPLEILSNIQETNLLKENTSVKYNHNGHLLPEDYNGLGYLNLFAIIFDIHIKLDEFKKINYENREPADINILFIEEPEAHTHPQMQYIFINNIKQMLQEAMKTNNGNNINLQTIISTHSSHIASQSDFSDIKYFMRMDNNNVIAKNLSELEKQYLNNDECSKESCEEENKRQFQFLKQYLTLNNAELFFAQKAIFIEGCTERILMPAIMKKLDDENETRLLSQNISIIEVGNYSHIFEKFLNFLNIKTLIITDLDSINSAGKACAVSNGGINTSNASIKYFLKNRDFNSILNLSSEEKIIGSNIRIAYQTNNNGYQARSFEDAFIAANMDFISANKDNFDSIKCKDNFDKPELNAFDLASECIKKKSLFATDILYYSDNQCSNWQIPEYIEEGLLWINAQ